MPAIAAERAPFVDVCTTTILVVHEEDLVQCGLRLLFGRQPWVRRCVHARSVADGIAVAERHAPQLVLLDVHLAERHGPGVGAELRGDRDDARVVLLTSGGAVSKATQHAYGAIGHVPRAWPANRLVETLRSMALGEPLPPAPPAERGCLSARQLEILGLVASGHTNAQIAQRLCLSPHTVKQHTSSLYRKLQARNRTHAVQTARHLGLLDAA